LKKPTRVILAVVAIVVVCAIAVQVVTSVQSRKENERFIRVLSKFMILTIINDVKQTDSTAANDTLHVIAAIDSANSFLKLTKNPDCQKIFTEEYTRIRGEFASASTYQQFQESCDRWFKETSTFLSDVEKIALFKSWACVAAADNKITLSEKLTMRRMLHHIDPENHLWRQVFNDTIAIK
jgi:hypothetical protein